MGNPVVYFEVLGRDHEALTSFYSHLFGWAANPVGEGAPYSLIDTGVEGGIPGGIGEAADGTEHVTFYVEVEDLEAALEEGESLGGKRVLGPTDFPGGQFAQLEDPEGHTIGLWKGTGA